MLSSKVRLKSGGYLELQIDADLVHVSYNEWEFIKDMVDALRDYEREKELSVRPVSNVESEVRL